MKDYTISELKEGKAALAIAVEKLVIKFNDKYRGMRVDMLSAYYPVTEPESLESIKVILDDRL